MAVMQMPHSDQAIRFDTLEFQQRYHHHQNVGLEPNEIHRLWREATVSEQT